MGDPHRSVPRGSHLCVAQHKVPTAGVREAFLRGAAGRAWKCKWHSKNGVGFVFLVRCQEINSFSNAPVRGFSVSTTSRPARGWLCWMHLIGCIVVCTGYAEPPVAPNMGWRCKWLCICLQMFWCAGASQDLGLILFFREVREGAHRRRNPNGPNV